MAANFVSRWQAAVMADKTLKPSERLVAVAMASRADYKTGTGCRPGPTYLAGATGLSERTVTRARRRLEDLGWLVREHTGGSAGKRTTNAYHLAYPCQIDPGQIDTHDIYDSDPGQSVHDPCHSDLPPTEDLHIDLATPEDFEVCRSGVRLAKLRLQRGEGVAS